MRYLNPTVGTLLSVFMMTAPALANTTPPPVQASTPQPQVNQRPHLDREAFQEMLDSKDPQKMNLAALIKFVDNESVVAGALRSCDAEQYSYFVHCSRDILINWEKVTGHPFPVLSYQNKDAEALVQDIWAEREDQSATITLHIPQKCPKILALAKNSKVWRFCVIKAPTPAPEETSSDTDSSAPHRKSSHVSDMFKNDKDKAEPPVPPTPEATPETTPPDEDLQ